MNNQKFLIVPKVFLSYLNKNTTGNISAISMICALLLSYFIRAEQRFSCRNKKEFQKSHKIYFRNLYSFFFNSMQGETIKARFKAAFEELRYFGLIDGVMTSEFMQLTFSPELTDILIPDENDKKQIWYSVPLVLFQDPISILSDERQEALFQRLKTKDKNKVNEYIFKKLQGSGFSLLIELCAKFCGKWMINADHDNISFNAQNFSQWQEHVEEIVRDSGLEFVYSSTNRKNTESHRLYRPLKLLCELGFISLSSVINKLGRIVFVSSIRLYKSLADLIKQLNSSRKDAYEESILQRKHCQTKLRRQQFKPIQAELGQYDRRIVNRSRTLT